MRFIISLLLLGLAGCAGSNYSAPVTVDPVDVNNAPQDQTELMENAVETLLPIDPLVRKGSLPNGLNYMIRSNERPENRAELRLVVNVGSILEDDDQLGLAHFVEHMAFNGTQNFEKQELIDYLESIGMQFGPDINAYTSFDETVYKLQLPTDSVGVLETGFQILRDWAGRLSFEPAEIEKERGVVIEEWRRRRGAAARIQDLQLPIILKDSRYADRLPIGNPDLLKTFSHETLVRYYTDWYRPELMTVIAVGDFETDRIERLIEDLFSDLTGSDTPRERIFYDVPSHDEVLYTIESDPEASSALVSVMYKHPPWAEGTRASYRQRLRSSLYSAMFNQRLGELTQSVDPPFIFAFSNDGGLVRTRGAYSLIGLVRDGEYTRALETLLEEAERVKIHGFTETELQRAKTQLLRSRETAFNEREKTNSSVFASEYIRHVLTSEAIPGIEYEYQLTSELLPTIPVEEVNQLLTSLMTETNQVVSISGPEKESDPLPTIAEVKAVFTAVSGAEVDAYVDTVDDEPLLPDMPTPGTITEERLDEEIGVTFMTLSNGIKIVLRPTDFKNDQILMMATSPGGTSLADDSEFASAIFASQLIGSGGVGTFGPIELRKKLSGKVVRVSPVLTSLSEGFSGSASPKDLETLFQLTHLYGTAPRADSVVFASYITRMSSFLETMKANPQIAFSDTLSTTMAQYHFRARPMSEEIIREVSLSESFDFYNDRFKDFSDFTFYFVGAFEIDDIKPFLTTYLASLPSTMRDETWVDTGIRTPSGVINKTVVKGVEPKSQVSIIFSGPADWSMDQRRKLGILSNVLRTRLREILREDLGGTYSVSVTGSMSDRPYESYRVTISFGMSPDRVDELIGEVFREIEALKTAPPDEDDIQKARESALREHEVGLRENGFWMNRLQFYLERGMDASAILEGPSAWIYDISGSDLQEVANRYLNTDRYVQVVLMPENER
ncbi:MAG: insulinase family protein [Rhodothermia bacterium]|nr:MAG: insulinase family protein [Rhodothermia bacterium]